MMTINNSSMYKVTKRLPAISITLFLLASVAMIMSCETQETTIAAGPSITHGPILGHVTAQTIRVWARTSEPTTFTIEYTIATADSSEAWATGKILAEQVETQLANDNTGWAQLESLQPNTKYYYRVIAEGRSNGPGGSFSTHPSAAAYQDDQLNPKGLFNFQFEYGSCASQNPANGIGYSLPTYTTMLDQVKDEVLFAVMNGDWLYEEKRDFPLAEWQKDQGIDADQTPKDIQYAPTTVGVWENYKTYLSRGGNLAEWHRHVPSYFTFDDHELINDIWGAGTAGRRDRRAVFRDIGTAAWYDYLGWANPTAFKQDIHFGRAAFEANSEILIDEQADFTQLNLDEMANLHVHWGTPTAGVDKIALDVDEEGDPNSRVYDIVEVLDKNRLRISPPASAKGTASYSIGRRSYSKFTVANCDFFLLDTRTHRQWHNTQERDQPGLTLLGEKQRDWLKAEMEKSEADFFFLYSSVPFMIPHIGAGGYEAASNKDESWTVFLDEREKLIQFWEGLNKPVFVLTGDLHNSFAIKITDHIWEFCAGPHNSVNHRLSDEGNRPATGIYQFDERPMDIRWSSVILDDIPRSERLHPFYCVVQINNVFNNPLKLGEERWVAYEHPQVIFKYYDGRSGEFRYSETISTQRK